MAGLVWNPPTSCAWAARVFVSNREARDHGRRCVGLPSAVAAFVLEDVVLVTQIEDQDNSPEES